MRYFALPWKLLCHSKSFERLIRPAIEAMGAITPLVSGCNRTMKFDLEHILRSLVYFHLQGFESGNALIEAMQNDPFAKQHIAPTGGLGKSTFFDALNSRGALQLMELFSALQKQARGLLPDMHPELGDLVAIDGSLIEAVASMHFATYREGNNKAKAHLGFSLNYSVPLALHLSSGKDAERPVVNQIIKQGQTGVLDRGYQCHGCFDQWQRDQKHFVCRIKKNTTLSILEQRPVADGGRIFLDATGHLGQTKVNKTELPVRVVAYRVGGKEYYIATDRFDLTAEEIAQIYKMRWDIEIFFGWWKRHLKVYHLIARSEHGLMVQILAGMITYLLLAIHCHEQHGEKVSIARVRELRHIIQQEILESVAVVKKHPQKQRRRVPRKCLARRL